MNEYGLDKFFIKILLAGPLTLFFMPIWLPGFLALKLFQVLDEWTS